MTNDRGEELVARFLDGRADTAERVELEARLCSDPAWARQFVAVARLEADLRQVHRVADAAPGARLSEKIAVAQRTFTARSARRRRLRPRGARNGWPLLAALVLLAVGVVVYGLSSGPSGSAALAVQAPFHAGDRPFPPLASLQGQVGIAGGGTIRLTNGTIAWSDGTALAPVLRLDQGEAAIQVAPRDGRSAFVVQTPHGEVRVLGTAFRLVVTDVTDVSVASGRVEVVAGGASMVVGPTGHARLSAGAPPVGFSPVMTVAPTGNPSAWNHRSRGSAVSAHGIGPTGRPVLRMSLTQPPYPWVVATWREPLDWSAGQGVSVVLLGRGSGEYWAMEVYDHGTSPSTIDRGPFARFRTRFIDDRRGWHERRLPFSDFVPCDDPHPDEKDDGLTTACIQGVAVIGGESPVAIHVERIGIYAAE